MRYLRCFDANRVTIIGNGLALIAHYFACKHFVLAWKLGLMGVALANTVSALLNIFVQFLLVNYVFSSDLRHLFNCPDKSSMSCEDCKQIIK